MSDAKVNFTPAPGVLRWARETAGMSIADVATRLDVTSQTVVRWESGERPLSIGRLETLAHLFRRPLAALFLPRPPDVPPLPHDFRVLPRGEKAPLSSAALFAIREARRIQSVARELAADLAQPPATMALPGEGNAEALHLAARERERIGIAITEQMRWRKPSIALKCWRAALERLNVLVLQFSMPIQDARGFSLLDDVAPAIVLNSQDAPSARVFTLFHEYAHLLRGSSAICIPDIRTPAAPGRETEEAFCNAFAGAFLVPAEPFGQALGGRALDEHALEQVALEFSVSRHVILHRLRTLGLLSRAAFESKLADLESQLTEFARPRRAVRISAAQRCVGMRGQRFVRLVLEAKARDLITYRDVADYLSLRVQHFDDVEAMVREGEARAGR